MSIAIKSGTTTLQSTKIKDFRVGVSGVADYGPTENTGFYPGITPPNGGYTIYVTKALQGPSIHVAYDDNQCIFFLKSFGSTGSTITDVLNWASNQQNIYVASSDLEAWQVTGTTMTFRYIKWTITKRKNFVANSIQVAELRLKYANGIVSWNPSKIVSNPGGSSPPGEDSSKAVDGSVNTKWLDFNFDLIGGLSYGQSILLIDNTTGITFNGYSWVTANDEPDRDPISWKLEGSNDNSNWFLLSQIDDDIVNDLRNTETQIYPVNNIVTNGLKVYLDAGNSASYPGNGSTWSDLSGNGYNATLYNTPTYSSDFGGILSFSDTSYEYADLNNIGDLSTWTIETWCRANVSLNNKVTSIISNEFDLSSKLNFSLGTNNAPSNYRLSTGFFNGAWRTTTGFTMSTNTWYHIVGTYDGSTLKMYVNNSLNNSLNYIGTPQSGGKVRIARRWDSPSNDSTNFFGGDVPIVRIYNRALNNDEISQNYNMDKNRYGY